MTKATFLIALLFASFALGRNLEIYEIQYEGKPYWAVVVRSGEEGHTGFNGNLNMYDILNQSANDKVLNRLHRTPIGENNLEVQSTSSNLAEQASQKVILNAQNWLLNYYMSKGIFAKDVDGKLRESWAKEESLLLGKSDLVLITEKGNLDNILAMSRFAKIPSQEALTPMEAVVKGTKVERKVPRLSPKIEEVEDYVLDQAQIGKKPTSLKFKKIKGRFWKYDTAEMKNFARKGEVNLIPAMMTIIAASGIARNGLQKPPATQNYDDVYSTRTSGIIEAVGDASEQSAHVGQIVGECIHSDLRDYYLSKGWKQIAEFEDPRMKGAKTYWLQIPIEEYNRQFLGSYTGELSNKSPLTLIPVAGVVYRKQSKGCIYYLSKTATSLEPYFSK